MNIQHTEYRHCGLYNNSERNSSCRQEVIAGDVYHMAKVSKNCRSNKEHQVLQLE